MPEVPQITDRRDKPNAISHMLGLIGDEWTLMIAGYSSMGMRRFSEFHEALSISNAVLSNRLGRLEHASFLKREIYHSKPKRSEYVPTERLLTLWPTLLAIREWEGLWGSGLNLTIPQIFHLPCGERMRTELQCRDCKRSINVRELSAAWGPSGSWIRSVPNASTRKRPESEASATEHFPQAMSLFGNRWSAALIGAAFRGLTRFSDFEAALGAPPSLIADRLRAFSALDVLTVQESSLQFGKPEYRLTPKGEAFYPVISTALHWAERWFGAAEGPAVTQLHLSCGSPFVGLLTCRRCHTVISPGNIRITPASPVGAHKEEYQ